MMNNPPSLRFMYWPNEADENDPATWQRGPRKAFAQLVARGEISRLSIYSYLAREAHLSPQVAHEQALARVEADKPDILFVQHAAKTKLTDKFWAALKQRIPELTIVYHEADMFGRNKPLTDSMKSISGYADLILLSGLGQNYEQYRRLSRAPIRYVPQSVYLDDFALKDPTSAVKRYDLVMIGNHVRVQRFRYLPGGRERAQLARRLADEHGSGFALYGAGWARTASAKGRLPFTAQEEAIQSARVSINWDHYDCVPYYFSDRLPISLAAAVPHITSYASGYENIFRDCPGIFTCRTVAEASDCARWLLSQPSEVLLDYGLRARDWVASNLNAEAILARAFDMARSLHLEHHRPQ